MKTPTKLLSAAVALVAAAVLFLLPFRYTLTVIAVPEGAAATSKVYIVRMDRLTGNTVWWEAAYGKEDLSMKLR